MNLMQSPYIRKGTALCLKPLRAACRWAVNPADSGSCGGVLCNSFPKSGTHLLLQILRSLPGTRYYGSFIASVPSIRFKLRSLDDHVKRIKAIAPAEIVPCHLYHQPAIANQLAEKNVCHFFIYRDPRAVVVSEAFYFTGHAWWHRMSRKFRRLPDLESQLLLSIDGIGQEFPEAYPNIAARFSFYQPWINTESCLAVKFEDLVTDSRSQVIRKIGEFYQAKAGVAFDLDEFVKEALAAIDPARSHTFRTGETSGWKKHFTPRVEARFNEVAGSLLDSLGYEH